MDNFITADAQAAIPALRRLLGMPHFASEQAISADWIFLKKGGLAHIREMLAERYFHLMQLGLFTRRWFGVILCRWNY
jgi:hypothetical protein